MKYVQRPMIVVVAAVGMIAASCAKKKVAAVPPPPPSPSFPAANVSKPTPAPVRTSATPAHQVSTPRSDFPNAVTRARIDELLAKIEDAYFDYNKASLRPDAVQALQADSSELRDILKDYPNYKLTVEGHCDERGSAEYNLALGDRRAEAARDYLVQVGIPTAQLKVVSYGKERPICQDHDENCWQKNRRIHILAMAQAPK